MCLRMRLRVFWMDRKLLECVRVKEGKDDIIRERSSRARAVTNAGEDHDLSRMLLWPRQRRDRLDQMDAWQWAVRQELGTVLQPLRQPTQLKYTMFCRHTKYPRLHTKFKAIYSLFSLGNTKKKSKSFSQDRKDEWMCSESSASMMIGAKVQKLSQHNTRAWFNCLKCNWC